MTELPPTAQVQDPPGRARYAGDLALQVAVGEAAIQLQPPFSLL